MAEPAALPATLPASSGDACGVANFAGNRPKKLPRLRLQTENPGACDPLHPPGIRRADDNTRGEAQEAATVRREASINAEAGSNRDYDLADEIAGSLKAESVDGLVEWKHFFDNRLDRLTSIA